MMIRIVHLYEDATLIFSDGHSDTVFRSIKTSFVFFIIKNIEIQFMCHGLSFYWSLSPVLPRILLLTRQLHQFNVSKALIFGACVWSWTIFPRLRNERITTNASQALNLATVLQQW